VGVVVGWSWRRRKLMNRIGNDRGFILIAVLWLLVSLSAVAIHAGLRGRSERAATANTLDHARSREVARAGAEYARSRLSSAMLEQADQLRSEATSANQQNARNQNQNQNRTLSVQRLFSSADPLEDPWRNPEELIVSEMTFDDAAFILTVRDTGAALNLNTAEEDMIQSFLAQGLRLDFALAEKLTQAILDWIDEDDDPRLGGGEREEYLRAGMAVLPPNRPFASIEELRYILGMTPQIFEEAAIYLTLSGSRINVNSAPEAVLLAIPVITPDVAAQLVRDRDSGLLPRNAGALLDLVSSVPGGSRQQSQQWLNSRVVFRTEEVEIISEGGIVGSPVRSRVRMIVERSDAGAIVTWRSDS
jgi:type II secretory pathway component PulK